MDIVRLFGAFLNWSLIFECFLAVTLRRTHANSSDKDMSHWVKVYIQRKHLGKCRWKNIVLTIVVGQASRRRQLPTQQDPWIMNLSEWINLISFGSYTVSSCSSQSSNINFPNEHGIEDLGWSWCSRLGACAWGTSARIPSCWSPPGSLAIRE